MKKYILISLFLLGACQLGSCQKENKNTSEIDPTEDVSSTTLTRDRIDSLLVSTSIFDISYNEIYEQPNWVKYTVKDVVKNADRDGMNFYTVDSIYTSDDNDYYSNRWDRGHMAPAGSFNDSYANLFSTFTYLNVALQYDDLNRGAWVGLESQIREWADELGDINVEIYLEFDLDHIILESGAHVPSAFLSLLFFLTIQKNAITFQTLVQINLGKNTK